MEAPSHLPENIVLIGFMGSGKTTIGRELQQRLGYPLVDTDHVIEQRAGMPVTEIFAREGETAFRDMETALLRELAGFSILRRIISTGGGIVGRPENRALLKAMGYVVWLHVSEAEIIDRTARNRSRPLLHTDDPALRIRQLMKEREPLYQETAHLKLDTKGLCGSEVASGILECARYFFSHRE